MRIFHLIIMVTLFSSGLISNGWSQNEPVTGYYDPANDWFVFEWDNPDYGRQRSIYDSPNKVKPAIKSEIDFNESEKEYTYNYEVANQEGAVQVLMDIVVDYFAPIYDMKMPLPQEDWYMDQFRVGEDSWHWAKTGGIPPGILAGQTEKGFTFKSKGLPGLVVATFFGEKRGRYWIPGDEDTEEVAISFDRVFDGLQKKYPEKFERVNVKTKTLGPTAPPADFKPVAFIDYIISLKHEAVTLGWIKNAGIVNSLDVKLENAKKAIERNNIRPAKNLLEAFINEVEAQGCASYEKCPEGKHITPEGYGLLKYNVEYLLERL